MAARRPVADPTLALVTDARARAAPPPALLPYQQNWVRQDHGLDVCEKSRRVGITWAEAARNVLNAAAQSGCSTFYIPPAQDMAVEYIEACGMWARAFNAAASEIEESIWEDGDRHIRTFQITFPKTRHRLVALSSRPSNMRGRQGDIVIDEAAFHADLDAVLKAALAMLLWGNRVRVISTHDGADNPFAALVGEVREGRRKGRVFRIPFREAVADGLYRRVCLRRGIEWTAESEAQWVADAYEFYGESAAEELDAIPARGSGKYLSAALIEARMRPGAPIVRARWPAGFEVLPERDRVVEVAAWIEETLDPALAQLRADERHAFGLDFARRGDLTVATVLGEGRDLVRRVRLVLELAHCPFAQQQQILWHLIERLPRLRRGAMDATGNGAHLAEITAQRFGAGLVEQAVLNDAWYLEAMPPMRRALEDATLDEIPRDAELRDDLRALELVRGVPKLGAPRTQSADEARGRAQRHGDFAIALMLAHWAATHDGLIVGDLALAPPRGTRYEPAGARGGFRMRAPVRAPQVPAKAGW